MPRRADQLSPARLPTARSWASHLVRRLVVSLSNRTWRRRSLAERYSIAASTWHDAIHRLGYLYAYQELIEHVGATPLSALNVRRADRRVPAVLDAGCGTGAFSLMFARWYASTQRTCGMGGVRIEPLHIDLLDPSPRMLDSAHRRHFDEGSVTTTMCGDIESIPLGERRYDVVLCSHVLEHIGNVGAALARLHEVLAPGGTLLLVASHPHWCTRLLQFKWGSASWSEYEVRGMLQRAHFAAVDTVRFSKGPPSRTSMGYVARRPLHTA